MADEQDIGTEAYITPLRTLGVQMNEVYEELKRSGFDKSEALYMVAQVLIDTVRYGGIEIIEDDNDESDNDDDYEDDGLTT
jgi:hypothetical protein